MTKKDSREEYWWQPLELFDLKKSYSKNCYYARWMSIKLWEDNLKIKPDDTNERNDIYRII